MTKTKREMDELIDSGDADALREAAGDPDRSSKLQRRILGRLCSHEPAVKWRAVAALGIVATEEAMGEKKASDLVERFLWALNDESGSVPFGIPEALGELIANRPSYRPRFTPILISYLVHKDMFQTGPILAGAIWAVGRVGVEDPEELERVARGLKVALGADEPEVRGAALWTAARLGLGDTLRETIESRREDDGSVTLLVDGEVRELRLSDL